jgi:hypothetical protein
MGERYVPSLADLARLASAPLPTHMHFCAFPAVMVEKIAEAHAVMQPAPEPKAAETSAAAAVPPEKFQELEAELSRLRDMIAMVVSRQVQEPTSIAGAVGGIPPPPPPPPPPPFGSFQHTAGAPPPPPPPPPPPGFMQLPKPINMAELVRNVRRVVYGSITCVAILTPRVPNYSPPHHESEQEGVFHKRVCQACPPKHVGRAKGARECAVEIRFRSPHARQCCCAGRAHGCRIHDCACLKAQIRRPCCG